mgnify:CR=1 FL=1
MSQDREKNAARDQVKEKPEQMAKASIIAWMVFGFFLLLFVVKPIVAPPKVQRRDMKACRFPRCR